MKYFIKGIGLGLSLNLLNRLIGLLFCPHQEGSLAVFSILAFTLVTTSFLVSGKISNLLLCGFTGLFVMFYCEIFVLHGADCLLPVYFYGMFGSLFAIVIASILTVKKIKLSDYLKEDTGIMTKQLKLKMLFYIVLSAIGFSYLVLPEDSGIGVPLFVILQFACLWFLVPDRKKLLWLIPVFLLSFNSFLSASIIWKPWNLVVCSILPCCMFLDFSWKDNCSYLSSIIIRLISSFRQVFLPFQWVLEFNADKSPVIKRIAVALIITIPCVILLILVLSSADMVFRIKAEGLITQFTNLIRFNVLSKGFFGILFALFLFGNLYQAHTCRFEKPIASSRLKGDLVIINILLTSILFVYTLFVIVQFRYLFAGAILPEVLTYTAYARKGFFELLALTGINMAIILTITKITRHHQGKWLTFSKILCHYLCAVTIILLVSSFYRMLLYTNDDGLTRLRFFVLGFLVFEAIGLLITFLYIARPRFNLTLIYLSLALCYYLTLNLIPTDHIIAKNQIQKYLNGERTDLEYVFTLSADAVPALNDLQEHTEDMDLQKRIDHFIAVHTESEIPKRWQRLNLSVEHAKSIK